MNYEHFTPDKLDTKKPLKLLFSGRTHGGKSYYFKQLWESVLYKHVDQLIIFCPSRSALQYDKDCFPYKGVPHKIFKTMDLAEIAAYLKRIQDGREQDYHDIRTIDGTKKRYYKKNLMIVFDDIANGKMARTDILDLLYTSGRHISISCVYLTQKLTGYTPTIVRTQATHVIIFKQGSEQSVIKLISEYIFNDDRFLLMSNMEKKYALQKALEIINKNYQCMICDIDNGVTYRK